jgi:predicted O-methyltransferase YrrM
MVYTLDLPEAHPAYNLAIPKAEERQIAAETGKGILIPQELRHKVTFLRSDSATFDTIPYLGSMDLVFVDGAHSYQYVKNDTEKGWEMLRPGGIIAWHDCTPSHPEVVSYLKSHTPIPTLVRGTALAFVKK